MFNQHKETHHLPFDQSPSGGQRGQGYLQHVSPLGLKQRGNVCPARTGPREGQPFPLEDRDLLCLASSQVKIATVRQKCAKLGKSQGSQPKFSPFSGRMRAGQTFPQNSSLLGSTGRAGILLPKQVTAPWRTISAPPLVGHGFLSCCCPPPCQRHTGSHIHARKALSTGFLNRPCTPQPISHPPENYGPKVKITKQKRESRGLTHTPSSSCPYPFGIHGTLHIRVRILSVPGRTERTEPSPIVGLSLQDEREAARQKRTIEARRSTKSRP